MEYSEDNLSLFRWEINFFDNLDTIGDVLRSTPRFERNEVLRHHLDIVNKTFLPSGCIYIPVLPTSHCVVSIVALESFCFSTKERVPFLLCLEVVDVIESLHHHHRRPKSKKASIKSRSGNSNGKDMWSARGLLSGVKARASAIMSGEDLFGTSDAEKIPLWHSDGDAIMGQWTTSYTRDDDFPARKVSNIYCTVWYINIYCLCHV